MNKKPKKKKGKEKVNAAGAVASLSRVDLGVISFHLISLSLLVTGYPFWADGPVGLI